MQLTNKWLKGNHACILAHSLFRKQNEHDVVVVLETLVTGHKLLDEAIVDQRLRLQWANWLIVRVLQGTQVVEYAVFAAEQTLDLYEKEYPNDKRSRQAIESAKQYIKNPCKETAYAAMSIAIHSTNPAAAAAYAAYSAFNVATNAAVYGADAAISAAAYAVNTIGYKTMLERIVNHGIDMIRKLDEKGGI